MNVALRLVEKPAALTPEEKALQAAIIQGLVDRHASLNHRPNSIRCERRSQEGFRDFTGGLPLWLWRREHMDAYGALLRKNGASLAQLRQKQGAVKRLLDYGGNRDYDWDDLTFALTGHHIRQICTRENTVAHKDGPATSKRRQLTDDELERLEVVCAKKILNARTRHERLVYQMHFAVLDTARGTGCREHELEMGDVADVTPVVTEEIAAYSPFENYHVRFGKSHDGGPATQRFVTATYPFHEQFATLDWYLREVRPRLVKPHTGSELFVSRRGRRLRGDSMSTIFRECRDEAGLSTDLTFHCLRHTFETKLRESGMEMTIISKLMGHASEVTTMIYDHVGPEFIRKRVLANTRRIIAKSKRTRTRTQQRRTSQPRTARAKH